MNTKTANVSVPEQSLAGRLTKTRPIARHKWKPLRSATIYAVLIVSSALILFPFLWMLSSSLKTSLEIFYFPPSWLPAIPQWDNYPKALTTEPFSVYILNTLKIEVGFVAGSIIANIFPAYSFARLRWRGRDAVFYMLLGVLLLPGFITLVPTFVIWSRLGLLDSFWPLVIPAWFGNPFFIFLLRQFFRTIPAELEVAAYIDGASHFRAFAQIVLPLVKPALAVVALFSFQSVWNDLLYQIIYLNSQENYTIALGLKLFLGLYGSSWELLMAASTAAVLPIAALFFLCQRYFIEGVTMTGLKG